LGVDYSILWCGYKSSAGNLSTSGNEVFLKKISKAEAAGKKK